MAEVSVHRLLLNPNHSGRKVLPFPRETFCSYGLDFSVYHILYGKVSLSTSESDITELLVASASGKCLAGQVGWTQWLGSKVRCQNL